MKNHSVAIWRNSYLYILRDGLKKIIKKYHETETQIRQLPKTKLILLTTCRFILSSCIRSSPIQSRTAIFFLPARYSLSVHIVNPIKANSKNYCYEISVGSYYDHKKKTGRAGIHPLLMRELKQSGQLTTTSFPPVFTCLLCLCPR